MLRRYSRLDSRGAFPARPDQSDLAASRLTAFWRPLVDGTDSVFAARRLRAIPVVNALLTVADEETWPWLSMIGVPGLRTQVLRHAGLDYLGCRSPERLPERYWTVEWSRLVEAMSQFSRIATPLRAVVIFQLAQLSFCDRAVQLAASVDSAGSGRAMGDPMQTRYAYEMARIAARFPHRAPQVLPVFADLATRATNPELRLASCFQGIGHCLRDTQDLDRASAFESIGRAVLSQMPQSWHANLVCSRYCRAVAMLHQQRSDSTEAWTQLAEAERYALALQGTAADPQETYAAAENFRYLLELRIQLAIDDHDHSTLRGALRALSEHEPNCVEARLLMGDGHLALGEHQAAAHWFELAGELGTGAGAIGWFRAGQCHDALGNHGDAVNAMGRCLELDSSAVEPRQYLSVQADRVSRGLEPAI